ncbi:MAG: hypothetical protein WAU88_10540 [Candidatus Zixiibacteriota bacterium]
MPIDFSVFSRKELQVIRRLTSAPRVQDFVTDITYNKSDRISIADVLRKRRGDCLEAAAFASIVLTYHAIPNFIMDLSSVRDEDHVLCVFRQGRRFGSIGQSKFLGLRYRNPVYANVRELAISYFESYYNFYGEYTLRAFSKPLTLQSLTGEQLTSSEFMHELEDRLCTIAHVRLVPEDIRLPRVSPTKFRQEVMIIPKGTRIGKRYRRI